MRKRVIALLVALATALGVGGFALSQASAAPATINPNPVAAGPYHSGNITCAQDGTRTFIVWDHYCPTGFHYAQIPAQDVYGSTSGTGLTQAQVQALIDAAVAKAVANIGTGLSPKKDSVTFDADWATNTAIKKVNAAPAGPNTAGYLTLPAANIGVSTEAAVGGRYYFVVTQTGISAYSTSTRELFGSNVASSTMASESDVQVEGVIQPAPGATSRSFVVSIATNSADDLANSKLAAFANSRHFTLQYFTYI